MINDLRSVLTGKLIIPFNTRIQFAATHQQPPSATPKLPVN